jgi:hypothetical protein
VSPSRQPPLGLVCGLAFAFVLYRIVDFAFAGLFGDDLPDYRLWRAVSIGGSFASLALLAAGALELRRRTTGRAQVGANLVLGGVFAMLATAVVRNYVILDGSMDPETQRWLSRFTITARHLTAAGFLVAGWHHRTVRLLAAPVAIVALVAAPYDFYSEYLWGWVSDAGRTAWLVVDFATEAAYTGLAIVVLWLGAPGPGPTGWDGAARALDRTAWALYARLWIAAISMLLVLVLFAGEGGSEGVGKLFVVGIPLANAVAGIVLIVGVLGAAQLTASRGVQLRFLAAGAAFTFVIAIQSVQVYLLVRGVFGDRDEASSFDRDLLQVLPMALPIVLAVGFLVLVDALRAVGGLLGFDDLRTHAAAAAVTVVVTQLAIVGAGYWMATSKTITRGTAIFAMLLIAGAAIGTLVAVARVCREAASGLRARTDLPTATVVTREP